MTSVPHKFVYALLAAPLLWLVPAFLHPMGEPYAGIADEADMWIFVHVAQLVLMPFLAAGVWMLLDGLQSVAAWVARSALVLWLVFFSAFDAVAGIATGVLTRHANSLTGDEQEGVVAAIDFLWAESLLANGGFGILGNLGHLSWVVVAIAATIAPLPGARRSRRGRRNLPLSTLRLPLRLGSSSRARRSLRRRASPSGGGAPRPRRVVQVKRDWRRAARTQLDADRAPSESFRPSPAGLGFAGLGDAEDPAHPGVTDRRLSMNSGGPG